MKDIHIINSISPENDLSDLDFLKKLGKAKIIAVGEGAHFIEEFWTLRQRLFRYFHEQCGFNVFAMEFGFAEGIVLSKWISGESDDDLEQYGKTAAEWGAGATLRWLRRYNSTRKFTIDFAGIDVPEAAGALLPAFLPFCKFAEKVEPALKHELDYLTNICEEIDSASSVTAALKWKALSENKQNRLTAGLSRLKLRFSSLRDFYIKSGGRLEFSTALRCLQATICTDYLIRAVALAGSSQSLPLDMSIREHFMAQSVIWYLTQNPDNKIFLLAHNNHIQKTPVAYGDYQAAVPMGNYLQQFYGNDYCAIALTSTDNHVAEMEIDMSVPVGFRVIDKPLETSQSGSFNAFIENSDFASEITYTDLNNQDLPDFQSIRSQSAYVTTSVKAAFDGVINLPQITADKDVMKRFSNNY